MELIVYSVGLVVFLIAQGAFGWFLYKEAQKGKTIEVTSPAPLQPPIINVDLQPILNTLDKLPHKVLQSVQSSSNTYKGALGELIGYMKLHAEYDRIVPLNNIVDFMCIKFPTAESEGQVDFIDVKTGDKSRLSKDQKALQTLIKEKRVNFIKLKVQTTNTTGVPTVESKP